MKVLSFRNVLHMLYQSDSQRMWTRWRNNQLGNGTTEEDFSDFQLEHFHNLIKDKTIQEFLEFDRCYKLADKYLLAMVLVYFLRTKLPLSEYTRKNFFVALYLAHDIEEDDEDLKLCFVTWGLGVHRRNDFDYFISLRNKFWEAMDHRACVSLKCCHKIMNATPNWSLWKRERDPAHGGAVRDYETEKQTHTCKHCYLLDESKRFYWSDYEPSEESASEDNNDEDQQSPPAPAKRMRMNEE